MRQFESLPQSPNPESEPPEKYIELGKQTAELISGIYGDLPPQFRQHLVDSNIVLTLAGLKGFTYGLIDVESEKDVPSMEAGAEKFNEYLKLHDPEVRVLLNPEIQQRRSDGSNFLSIAVENLRGYEQTTKETQLPGVPLFKATNGFDRLEEWQNECVEGLEAAQKEGKIPPEFEVEVIFQGIELGYPDLAITDFAQWIAKNRSFELEEVPINYAHTYKEAVPMYDVKPEHVTNPSIIRHSQRLSNVLKGFYESEWHQKVAPELISHRQDSHT
jgi:hypothetical protein